MSNVTTLKQDLPPAELELPLYTSTPAKYTVHPTFYPACRLVQIAVHTPVAGHTVVAVLDTDAGTLIVIPRFQHLASNPQAQAHLHKTIVDLFAQSTSRVSLHRFHTDTANAPADAGAGADCAAGDGDACVRVHDAGTGNALCRTTRPDCLL